MDGATLIICRVQHNPPLISYFLVIVGETLKQIMESKSGELILRCN